MKTNGKPQPLLLFCLLSVAIVLPATSIFSQPPPPPPPVDNPTDVPIDGGLSFLLVAGAAYGLKRCKSNPNKVQR